MAEKDEIFGVEGLLEKLAPEIKKGAPYILVVYAMEAFDKAKYGDALACLDTAKDFIVEQREMYQKPVQANQRE